MLVACSTRPPARTEAVLSNGAAAQPGDDLVLNANVTVLRTETHLPPVTPTTPLHQVLAAITTDGLAAPAEPAAAGAPDPATTAGPERQLVRTLDIRLEPPDLGSVTVKLRLSGEHLTLRISADSAATAQSLEQDRDTLAAMLRSNGYSPEISAVRHEPVAATAVLNASSTDICGIQPERRASVWQPRFEPATARVRRAASRAVNNSRIPALPASSPLTVMMLMCKTLLLAAAFISSAAANRARGHRRSVLSARWRRPPAASASRSACSMRSA